MANDINNSSLFSEKQLNEMSENRSNISLSGPVTVLGMTFPSDEERRRFFREELRKKLPELRKIEGFPIGEDNDIINLSDPPYYTACPNPWLNDFIAEWEQEKEHLVAGGERREDFKVVEPYASDIKIGKNNPIYNAHSYHTKVPHPAIMRYILHYTQPGDIVFDGFAGTGMTGVAASMCGAPDPDTRVLINSEFAKLNKKVLWGKRNSICGDLSPYASFIAYNYNTHVNPEAFEEAALNIVNEVESQYGWMYETRHTDGTKGIISFVVWSDVFTCPYCGKEIVYYNEGVDDKNKTINDVFVCPHCGVKLTKKDLNRYKVSNYDDALDEIVIQTKSVPVLIKYTALNGKRYEKKPDSFDLELINKIQNMEIPFWFPTDKMMGIDGKWGEQWRSFHEGLNNVHHFFTRRNLFIAAAIYSKTIGRGVLNVMMTSYLVNIGSKMARYKMGKSGNVNMPGTLYVASATAEQNLFQGYRGKIKDFKKAYQLSQNGVVNVSSASDSVLNDCSVDYIFTDPPFGDNIMYSELNYIQESWLKVKTHNQEEAIISSFYKKGNSEYQILMQHCFVEYYRILKPGHWITIEFSNTRSSVWNAIQQALQNSGFVIANVASLDKKQGSYNAVTSTTAVKQDLIISCFKPTAEMIERFETSGDIPENAWAFIEMLLNRLDTTIIRNGELRVMPERTPRILFDKLVSYYVAHSFSVPMNALDFQQGLNERFIERDGMYFTPNQALEYEDQKKTTPVGGEVSIYISSEREGIEWLRRQLIRPQTYAELTNNWMSMLQKPKKGDQIPELMDVLKENFIKEDDGKWVIPDSENQAHLTIMRNKRLRKQFDLFVEQAARARRLTDTNIEALRYGFTECYKEKDFATIVKVAEKLPESLLMEDEVLLQFYDIAISRV